MPQIEVLTRADIEDLRKEIAELRALLTPRIQTNEYLRSSEARKILGNIAGSTLKYYRDSGKLKFKQAGENGRYFYSKDSINQFLNDKN